MIDDLLIHQPAGQEQTRQLCMTMLACINKLGADRVMIDEDDTLTTCRLALVADCMVAIDFAGDASKSRFRELHLYMVEAGGEPFILDPLHRLVVFKAQHFGRPVDWHWHFNRPPGLWLQNVMALMVDALKPHMPAA